MESALDADAHWEMVSALIGDLDLNAAQQAGLATLPGTADQAGLQLTSAEQQELLRLLREELQRAGG